MTLPEANARNIRFLVRCRKYIIVLYAAPTFFACLATWSSFRSSGSLPGLLMSVIATVAITCLMFYFYKKVVSTLEKAIANNRITNTQERYTAIDNMTESARKEMQKVVIRITSPLLLMIFVSVVMLVVLLVQLFSLYR